MQNRTISTSFGILILASMFGFSVFMVSAQDDNSSEEPMHDEPKAQMVDKREISDFQKEMKNLVSESKKLLGDLKKVKDSNEWQQTIQEIIKNASSCASKVLTIPNDDRRSHIDDCRSERYWDSMNEIRDEFVPPHEIKNAFNDIKRQLKDLGLYRKQLLKATPGADTSKIDQLASQVSGHKTSIESAKGKDQREALQEFWSGNYGDEINKIRIQVELPKELKNITKEITFAEKDSNARQTQKAFEFFGFDKEQLNKLVQSKKENIAQMQALMDKGDYEGAGEMMQESVHEGWHPGDLRHFVGMMREAYDRMKSIKDKQILDQIFVILEPIEEGFAQDDVRGTRDGMVEFMDQMRKYESVFRPYYRGGTKQLDKKTRGALEAFEDLIQKKIEKGELKKQTDDDEDENKEMPSAQDAL